MFENIFLVTKPIIILSLSGLVVLMLEVFLRGKFKRLIIFVVVVLGLLVTLYHISWSILHFGGVVDVFGGSLRLDELSLGISFILVFGTLLVVIMSYYAVSGYYKVFGDYYSLLLFSLVGMVSLSFSNDLFTFFISFELMSVSVYILSGFYVRDFRSNESAIKYLVLGAFATAFLLLGIAFVYGVSGEVNFDSISVYFAGGLLSTEDMSFVLLGIGFMLFGFLFKVGAFPFHQWVPDVYEGAPTPVTAFMSTSVKAAAFAIFLRVLFSIFKVLGSDYVVDILVVVAVITLVGGNFLALVQSNIKRLLAFSGIAHTGYLLIYLVAGLGSSVSDYEPVLFYLLAYSLMNIGAFSVLVASGEETLDGLRGLGYRSKFLGFSMSVFLFSLAGIPSTAGFMGKFFIFKYAIGEGLYLLSIVGILMAVVSVYYYLRVIVYMYLKDEGFDYPALGLSWTYLLVAIVSVILTMLLGIFPNLGFYLLLG